MSNEPKTRPPDEWDWLQDVPEEEILERVTQQDLRFLIREFGVEGALTMMREYPGMAVYIPKPDTGFRMVRDDRIREEFDGGNIRALARKFRLSESRIREILNPPKQSAADQGELFATAG